MTLPIIEWDQAYNRNGDPKLPRAVVNVIRTYMDNRTLTGWVGAEKLAQATGLTERGVRKQLAANVAAGWLEITEQGRFGKVNSYRLTYPHEEPQFLMEDRKPHEEPQFLIGTTVPPHEELQFTPTTPRTSPQEKFDIGTTPTRHEEPQFLMETDPWGSGVDLPATETTTHEHEEPQFLMAHEEPEFRYADRSQGGCRYNPFCDQPQPCGCG